MEMKKRSSTPPGKVTSNHQIEVFINQKQNAFQKMLMTGGISGF
jgi:hypothetical protein